ncbi:hypothetical protein Q3G72_002300 [Acer saccharum]|nr:hypothetical protein Q3G72_002300 [Acer saccharum]
MMGIPLLLEEETRKKSRLDRGRLLISIPTDFKCPKKIKVQDRSRMFEIFVVLDESPVDHAWINSLLGLWNGKADSNSNSLLEHEWFESPSEKVGAQVPMCQHFFGFSDKSHSQGMDCQVQKASRTKCGKVVHKYRSACNQEAKKDYNTSSPQTKERHVAGDTKVKKVSDKGKKVIQKKVRVRNVVHRFCNTTIILKRKGCACPVKERLLLPALSILQDTDFQWGDAPQGPNIRRIVGRFYLGLPKSPTGCLLRPWGQTNSIGYGPWPLRCVEGTNVPIESISCQTKKRKGSRKDDGAKTHGMKTKNKKFTGVLSWNLEAEYVDAIERQYCKRNGQLCGNMDTLSLEMEIAKILETSAALGLDYQGREEEFSQVIAQREEEDNVRYQEMIKKQ